MVSPVSPSWTRPSTAPRSWVVSDPPIDEDGTPSSAARGWSAGSGLGVRPSAEADAGMRGTWWTRRDPDQVPPSTLPELVLLACVVLSFPFDQSVVLPGGISITYLFVALLALVVITRHFGEFVGACVSPLALPVWAFVLCAAGLELRHEASSLTLLARVVQMSLGIFVFAAAARDERALRWLFHSTILMGVGVSMTTIPSTLGIYSGLDPSNSAEVRSARLEGVQDTIVLEGGINAVALIMALGGVVAIAHVLSPGVTRWKVGYLVAGVVCLAGSALTASRGSTVAAAAGLMVVVLAIRGGRWRAMAVGALCVLAVVLVVPSAAFSRLYQSYDDNESRDPRSELNEAVFKYSSDWIPFGVGAAAYYGNWGVEHGFAKDRLEPWRGARGTHNAFTQIVVLWGLPTLAALLWLVVGLLYRVTRSRVVDRIRVPLLGVLVTLVAEMMVAHDIYDKDYSIWFGAAIGVMLWGVGAATDDEDERDDEDAGVAVDDTAGAFARPMGRPDSDPIGPGLSLG